MVHGTHNSRGERKPHDLVYVDQVELRPGARAKCLDCDEILIAKCGEINRWHWAHEASSSDCAGGDGEGAWHKAWKAWAERQGARTEVAEGVHRADALWPDGSVWEFQSSYLSPIEIARREAHWGDRLTWIYRITPGRFDRLSNCGEGWFRWRRPAVSMTRHGRPVIWHVRDRLLETTVVVAYDEVRVRFARGEDDQYGPVLYGSKPAPFDLTDAVAALRRLNHPNFERKAAS